MKTFGIHVKNVTNHLIEKLQVHVKSAHENIWHLCVKCDNSFAGQDELQKHVRSDHECIWQRQGESLKSWK